MATKKKQKQHINSAPSVRKTICSVRSKPVVELPPSVAGARLKLILAMKQKWANGTVLAYSFFPAAFKKWTGTTALKDQVREAFDAWASVGIGIKFAEVSDLADAQIRIGFERNDGHWSYVGRDILGEGEQDRTMNLDPADAISVGPYGIDVACHEIGHTLGFPHEHQNPVAGIMWDDAAVYAALAAPPNNWDHATTFSNIIQKISPDSVQGSSWDPDSIMHYPFEPGLILAPEPYPTSGVTPAGGLSARDRQWVKTFYPAKTATPRPLKLATSEKLKIAAGEQVDFTLSPASTRYYKLQTVGAADTLLLLFENNPGGDPFYLTADDNSGKANNASIRFRLHKGKSYLVKVRLVHAQNAAATALLWS